MENLGAMADLRYTGFREITDHDVLDLYCRKDQFLIFAFVENKSVKTLILIERSFIKSFILIIGHWDIVPDKREYSHVFLISFWKPMFWHF